MGLHRRGRGLRRLRRRRSALGGRTQPRARAGGGRLGSAASPSPCRPRASSSRSATRATTGPTRPSRTRRGAGRRDLMPRGKVLGGTSAINGMSYVRGQPADYDGLGRRGLPRLGLRERAPLLQARGGQREWRRRLPRHGRAARGLQPPHPASPVGSLPPVLRRDRHAPHGRRQHAAAGGRRLRARDPAPGAALERGAGLPAPGDGAAEPAGNDARACAARAVRGQASQRRRVHPPGAHRAGRGSARGNPLRRHVRFAAASDALGRGPPPRM